LDAACIRQDAAEIMSGTQRCFSLKKKKTHRLVHHACCFPRIQYLFIFELFFHTDPLRLLGRPAGRDGSGESSPSQNSRSGSPRHGEPPERLKREQSVKANRRHKFMDCLSCDDVDMGPSAFTYSLRKNHLTFLIVYKAELRKLAWSGIPDDLRPLAWPLLLVRSYVLLHATLMASSFQGLSTTPHAAALIHPRAEAWRVSIARRSHLCQGQRWPGPANMAPDRDRRAPDTTWGAALDAFLDTTRTFALPNFC
jgi:hypothetical protein